jgi:uncharacterized membrane protein YbhN (UPF0104 family)
MMRRIRRSWRATVGLTVLVVIIVSVDPRAVRASLANADLRLVLIGVLCLTVVHVVPALGWREMHGRTTGQWLPWRTTLQLFYAAQAIGGVTPANLGGDLHRATALRARGQDWASAITPLLLQRATSYLALSALAIAAAAILAMRAPVAGGIAAAGVAVAVALAGIAWILAAPPRRLAGARDRLTGRKAQPLARSGTAAAIGVTTGLVFHAAAIGATGLLVLAVDPDAPILPVIAALAVARLALAIPVTPSGLGVQEGVLAVLFAALGVATGTALASMLFARIGLLLTTLIGVPLLVRTRHAAEANASPSGHSGTAEGNPARPVTKNVPLTRG